MSQVKFKFIERLSNLIFDNQPVVNGDRVDVAIGKLQGQIDSKGAVTELRVDNGQANTTFQNYVLRLDFGQSGANINPTGIP